jgi:hypothetical protein
MHTIIPVDCEGTQQHQVAAILKFIPLISNEFTNIASDDQMGCILKAQFWPQYKCGQNAAGMTCFMFRSLATHNVRQVLAN